MEQVLTMILGVAPELALAALLAFFILKREDRWMNLYVDSERRYEQVAKDMEQALKSSTEKVTSSNDKVSLVIAENTFIMSQIKDVLVDCLENGKSAKSQ